MAKVHVGELVGVQRLGALANRTKNQNKPRRSKRLCPQGLRPSSHPEGPNSMTSLSSVASKKSLLRNNPAARLSQQNNPSLTASPPPGPNPAAAAANCLKRNHHYPEAARVLLKDLRVRDPGPHQDLHPGHPVKMKHLK